MSEFTVDITLANVTVDAPDITTAVERAVERVAENVKGNVHSVRAWPVKETAGFQPG